jgi:Zn-dependent protease
VITARSIEGVNDKRPRRAGETAVAGGLAFGRIFGIPVFVSPWWFVIAAWITVSFAPFVREHVDGIGETASLFVAAGFALLLYGSVFVHELSHSLVAKALGLPVRRIVLMLLGGVSEITKQPETAAREYMVSVVGPMTSILLAGVGAAITPELPHRSVARLLAGEFAYANLIVGVFNLLPGLPLDGGRVLRSIVWGVSHNPQTATRAAGYIGRVLAVLIVAAPLVVSSVTGRPSELFFLLYVTFLAMFIWYGASQALISAKLEEVLPRISARTLTRRALPVQSDLPLAEAVRRARAAGARALVVVDRDGKPDALVSEAAVAQVPEQRQPWLQVGELARRVEEGLVVSADATGKELVEAIQRTPASEYLVLERSGAVYGVLTRADLVAAMASKGLR